MGATRARKSTTSSARRQDPIVFVNTRAQAELMFQALWRLNEDNLAIGLHHGSLAVEQRRKVEAAMAAGKLRAVVATSSLDLGIDWGDVDQVIQVGAPKGVCRLMQRIGRANHRLDEPSRAMIAPANRFEVLECWRRCEAVEARELDGDPPRPPCLDVLAQHIVGCACAQPIDRDELLRARCGAPRPTATCRARISTTRFDFVATGGYALAAYERWHRLKQLPDGRWMLASPVVARQFRMNVGTIVELPLIKVKLRRGPVLGEVEESFIQGLVPGDTFVFAGRMLRFEGSRNWWRNARRRPAAIPRCRPMAAAACRSRPSWPSGCAASCRIPRGIRSCRPRCANGCACSASARPCPSSNAC